MRYLVLSDVHANLEALDGGARGVGRRVGPGAGARRSRRLWRRPQRGHRPDQALPVAAHGARQPRQGGLRPRRRWTASTRWRARRSSGPPRVLTPENLALAGRRCRRGRSTIDELTAICHGAPWDEDAYVFDERDVERAQPLSRAAAVPVRPHARAEHLPHRRRRSKRMLPIRGERCRVSIERRPAVSRELRRRRPAARRRCRARRSGCSTPAARAVTIVRTPYDVARAQAKILAAGLPAVAGAASSDGALTVPARGPLPRLLLAQLRPRRRRRRRASRESSRSRRRAAARPGCRGSGRPSAWPV